LDDLGAVLDETGTTTIMVSHDLVEVVKIASQMAIFLDNRLQQVGKPEKVFSAPKNAEVADFLKYSPSDILPKVGKIN
jgi:ABC-type sugar transport system ATPase subunit